MADRVYRLDGQCHCGSIRATIELSKSPAETPARTCSCGFCTRHGTKMISDPAGRIDFSFVEGALSRYCFATETCTMLLCRNCGAFVAALSEGEGQPLAVVNVRGLGIEAFRDHVPALVSFDGESAKTRSERHRARWMPASLRVISTTVHPNASSPAERHAATTS